MMESKMEMLFSFKNCPSDQEKLTAENLKNHKRGFIFETFSYFFIFGTGGSNQI